MPSLSSGRVGRNLAGTCFAAWVLLLALNAVWMRSQTPDPAQGVPARAAALQAAGQALDALKAATGAYPGTGGAWRDITPEELASLLAPSGLTAPAGLGALSGLLYRSDGRDYKLILHGAQDCSSARAQRPSMIDAARTAHFRTPRPQAWEVTDPAEFASALERDPSLKADPRLLNPLFGVCWAWGVWSQGGADW